MLKILYYFGMLKNLWIFCDLCYCICLLFQNDPFFHPSTETSTDGFRADFWPRNSLGFLLSSIQVMLGLLWQNDVNTCVCPEICVFVWTYLHNICMMYVYNICIYLYMCVIWQTRRTFLMMMHMYLRMLICIFPSKKVKTMAEDLPHSVDVKEKTWSFFFHRTRRADHRRYSPDQVVPPGHGESQVEWVMVLQASCDDAKTSEKRAQKNAMMFDAVRELAGERGASRTLKGFFWLCGS